MNLFNIFHFFQLGDIRFQLGLGVGLEIFTEDGEYLGHGCGVML